MTEGILSAHSTCWLRKCQGKLSSWPLRNHHGKFLQRWQKESSAPTTPVDSETIKKNRVAALSEIITENVSRGDQRIRQRTQPLLTHKQSRKTESPSSQKLAPETVSCDDTRNPQCKQHLLTQKMSRKTESLTTQKSSPKLFSEITQGILNAHSTCWLRKSQGKLSP